MTVLQGSEESADPSILSDFDERKVHKSSTVTKHMGHIDFKDFFSPIPCVQLSLKIQMENTVLKRD